METLTDILFTLATYNRKICDKPKSNETNSKPQKEEKAAALPCPSTAGTNTVPPTLEISLGNAFTCQGQSCKISAYPTHITQDCLD